MLELNMYGLTFHEGNIKHQQKRAIVLNPKCLCQRLRTNNPGNMSM